MDRAELRRVVDGRWAEVRQEVRRVVPADWCLPVGDLDREAHRSLVLGRTRALAESGLPGRGFTTTYGGQDDIGGSLTFFEMLGLVDRLATAAGRDDDDATLDRDWQVSLFQWRETHVVAGLARRLRRAAESDDPFEVVNRAQEHMLRAATSHVHRLVLESFVEAIAGCADEETAGLLGRLCDLYALAEVEADRGWFLEHGRLTPSMTKAVTRAVDDLCRGLRPHAAFLVDGLGIPRDWLGAELVAVAQPSRSST